MSKGDRDHRGRMRSGKLCAESLNGGCPRCVTGEYKRLARRRDRHKNKHPRGNDAQP